MITRKQLTAVALTAVAAAIAATPSAAQAADLAREQALRECSTAAAKYYQHGWCHHEFDRFRACMAERDQME